MSTCLTSPLVAQKTNVVIEWNRIALDCIKSTHTGPTVAARALSMVHTSMFDAWSIYDPNSRPVVPFDVEYDLKRARSEQTIAINYAAYRTLLDLFPTQVLALEAAMTQHGLSPSDTTTDLRTPAGIGNAAAEALIAVRHYDGSNQLGGYADTTGYAPVNTPDRINNPDHWQPLLVPDGKGGFVVQKFLTAQWETVTPFAPQLRSVLHAIQDRPVGYKATSEEYTRQADEIIHLSAELNDREKVIAEYWALGPGTVTPLAAGSSLLSTFRLVTTIR
jgi:hypothetical protein